MENCSLWAAISTPCARTSARKAEVAGNAISSAQGITSPYMRSIALSQP
nr:hypothetical protein [Citrobacter amalonaticus]